MKKLMLSITIIFIGGLVYLLFRAETLLMFSWIKALRLDGILAAVRSPIESLPLPIPQWFIYSLPNTLWLIGGLLLFNSIWGADKVAWKYFWFLSFLIAAIGAEVGQGFGFIAGTFDLQDLLFMVAGGILTLLIIISPSIKRKEGKT